MDYSLLVGLHFKSRVETPIIEDVSAVVNKGLPYNEGFTSTNGEEIYYIGLIDILQKYNFSKKSERFFKVYLLRKDKVKNNVLRLLIINVGRAFSTTNSKICI